MSSTTTGRRLASLLVVLALVGAPALILRALCIGRSCDDASASTAPVPFCSLPDDLRASIAAGFRAGRSPDVMATSGGAPVVTRAPGLLVGWPWMGASPSGTVPLAFVGPAVTDGSLPDAVGLVDVAPTLAALVGYDPPHPDVRVGRPIPGLEPSASGPAPLAVEIVWKGVGTQDLGDRWPAATDALIRTGGAGTLRARVGSLPLDPAAVLTTIGTGGLPSQHGITGTVLRADQGGVARAWAPGAPESVITTLPDELDHDYAGRARVGLVATASTDRGLIGDGWYVGTDRDQVIVAPEDPVNATERLLDRGYGADGVPDVLGVVLRGPIPTLDERTAAIITAVQRRVPDAIVVVTATGTLAAGAAVAVHAVPAEGVARAVDRTMGAHVIEADAAGGYFLDSAALASTGRSADAVVQTMAGQSVQDGSPLFADVYPGFSVAFDRYC
jgi:hypothetical protein